MKSWLDDLVKAHQNMEAPSSYYYWSGLAVLSAITRKQVYLNRFNDPLYPNIYVMIISERSGLRKGAPINLARKLLLEVQNTRVFSGRYSIQGMIKELSNATTLENGTVITDAHGIMLADEFSAYLVDDPRAFDILTGLYNTHEHNGSWSNTLKGSARETLKNPYICMLAAANKSLLDTIVKNKEYRGGFIARTQVIYESKRQCRNDLTDEPEGLVSASVLAQRLKDVAKLKGPFIWTVEGKKIYKHWYQNLDLEDQEDKTGALDRVHDNVLKIAMLLSLAEGDSLELTADHITTAIDKCIGCIESGTNKIVKGAEAPDELAPALKKVLEIFDKMPNREISRKSLISRVFPLADSMVIDKILETMLQAGSLTVFKDSKGGTMYRLSEEAQRDYRIYKGARG